VYPQQWYSEVRRITKQIGRAGPPQQIGGAGLQGSIPNGSSDRHFTEFKDEEEEVDVYASDDFEEDDPVVLTDETKGGNREEHDDLYNSEPSPSVGELATEQDRDPG
jgi:hypothetical protein